MPTKARVAHPHRAPIEIHPAGPMTIIDTIADKYYGDRVKMAFAFAELLNEEAKALQADGVDAVSSMSPPSATSTWTSQDWGIKALERAAEGPDLRDRRAHLLRLRHQGQHRLEADAGQRWRQYEEFSRR